MTGGPGFEREGAVRVLWPCQTGVGTLGRVGFDVRDRSSRAPGLFGGPTDGQFRAAPTDPPLDECPQLLGARRDGDPLVVGPQIFVDADALPLSALTWHSDHLPCLDTPKRNGVAAIDPCEYDGCQDTQRHWSSENMTEIATTESDKTARFGGVRAVENLPHSCSCGARWGGNTTAHCGAGGCHLTFSGVSTFDRHHRGGACTPPAEVGMSLVPGRPYECWGFPGEVTE